MPTNKERWFWVDLGYATFGINSVDNVVKQTAPIAQWMVGKTLQEIKPWLVKKKARIIEL